MRPRRFPLCTIIVAATLVVSALLAVAASADAAERAPGPDLGWVRLGHLSPKVPPVDVYLSAFGGPERAVVRKAGYGAVTPYSSLRPGAYTVAMRPADAAPTSPPALTATVEIAGDTAYSLLVFATGPDGTLRGDLVVDDLTAPGPGTGRVRVVQGTSTLAPVTVEVGGASNTLADAVSYGVTTPYQEMAEGNHSLELRGGSGRTPTEVDVRSGSSTTLLVTESDGALVATALVDSAGPGAKPLLGVETGAGGTAAPVQSSIDLWPWPALAALALLAAAALGTRRPARR
ncbi:DUF4397 domain-containing protein [Actinokineospora pegani]|uniref:DUF4397 domain-containing protein n=1 Tax=Actinokineospora pegani TaxID=2654637 RepID=UPI0012EAA0C6|nr:DUF4397 domain-containing protein [Actinokineospora pegani]